MMPNSVLSASLIRYHNRFRLSRGEPMKKKSRLTYYMVLAMLVIVVVGTFLHLAHAQEARTPMSSSPVFQVIDESFAPVAKEDAQLATLAEGLGFTEGPVWVAAENALIFSDIPRDTLHRYTQDKGLEVYRKPSHHANGNILDLQGRLITCEHGARRVTRTDKEGKITVLAKTYNGKKLNSPNDVAVKSDGTIWFTDPPYGLDLKKLEEQMEQPGCYVYRLDVGAQEPVAVAKTLTYPNGLCFSPDEKILYVADSHHKVHKVYRFDVTEDNTLEDKKLLADIRPGLPDGIRCDVKGRLYVTCGEGVQVYDSEGKLLGKILTPKTPANCCFGGPGNRMLYLTAQDSIYRLETGAEGFFPKPRKQE
jgi:gluconolactonase